VYESIVIDSPLDTVWALVRPLDFKFLSNVASTVLDKDVTASTVGGSRTVTYKCKTVQKVKLLELSDSQNFVTYEIWDSVPAVTYKSAVHTIRLRRVTQASATFVEFVSDYSSDATTEVTLDSSYKKKEFFHALQGVSESRASRFLNSLDFSKVTHLTDKQVEEAWVLFDTNKNGTLEPNEIKAMIEALLKRLSEDQSEVVTGMTSLFAEVETDKLERKESNKDSKPDTTKLASGLFAEMKKKVPQYTREIMSKLDRNRDGKIDLNEFKVLFPAWFEKKVREVIRHTYF